MIYVIYHYVSCSLKRKVDLKLSPTDLVSEVIFKAATENSDQLRYRAGEDAEFLLSQRKKLDDGEFYQMMKHQPS